MAILSLEPQERLPFLGTAIASACAASGALIARAAADTIFLEHYGVRFLSVMYLGTSILVGIVSFGFARYLPAVSLHRLIIVSCALLGLAAFALRLALMFSWSSSRILAYFWGDLTVNGSLLLFWSFFGQVFDFRRAKKLLGGVGASGTLACIAAGFLIRPFARQFGTANLLIIVAGLMFVFAGAVFLLTRRPALLFDFGREPASAPQAHPVGLAYYSGLLKAPRLRSLALQAMVGTTVIVLVDYQFKAVAQSYYQGPRLAAFFGDFYAATNVLVLLIQLFALHLFLRGKGLLTSLCVLPGGLLVSGSGIIVTTSLAAVLVTKLVAQTTLFTIDTGAFQILYLGIKKQTRVQLRALVDGICRPAAIGITGAALVLVSGVVKVYSLALPGVFLCLVWFYLARRNYNYYLSGLIEGLDARLIDLSEGPHVLRDKAVETYTRRALPTANIEELPYLLSLVQHMDEIDWSPEIRRLLKRPEPEVKLAALEHLQACGEIGDQETVLELARHPVPEIRRAAIRAAGPCGEAAMSRLQESLDDPDPGVRAEAATALIDMGHFSGLLQGIAEVKGMLESKEKFCRIAVASPLSRLQVRGRTDSLLRLLDDPEPEVRIAALRACANTPEAELVPKVISQLGDAKVGEAAAEALVSLGPLTTNHLVKVNNHMDLAALFHKSHRLPSILEKIGGPEALEVLQRALNASETESSPDMIKAYRRLLQRLPSLNAYLGHWEAVLQTQLASARKRKNQMALAKHRTQKNFLFDVLQEEYLAHLENVFTLLGLQSPAVKIEVIFSQLQDTDVEQRSRALEILEHIIPDKWKVEVLDLIDSKLTTAQGSGVHEFLRDAMSSECSEPVLWGATYAAAENNCSMATPLIKELLTHCSGVVRETALFALARLEAPETVAQHCRESLGDPDERVRVFAQSLLNTPCKSPPQGGTPMIVVEKILFLRHVPLFSNMTTNELEHVASIAKEVTFPAGFKIIREGDHGDHMFLIVDGEVTVQRGDVHLKTLGPRDFFGEMSIIDGEPRSASAIAVSDCLLLRIDKQDFQGLLSTYNSAAVSVVRALNRRLREVLPAVERAQRGM